MASEGSTNSGRTLPLLLALICAGLAGNYFRYPIFLGIDFLFGSIFAMLALQFFGPGRGLLAALLVSSYTIVLWNHPYAVIIMGSEMALVGWLFTRRKMGMVLADTLFWIFLGMPLVYLFYHVVMHASAGNVHITMVKQALNGIANALAARLLFTGYALRSRTLTVSFRETLYNLLAMFVLLPALILLAVSSRADFADTDRSIRSALLSNSKRITTNLDRWLNIRKTAVVQLARLAATRPPPQMQAALELVRDSDPYFLRIGLHNKEAVTTAYAPLKDDQGNSNIGRNFADRPFIPLLKATHGPLLSEIVPGRVDASRPGVLALAPVLANGGYAGYVAGVLKLDRVKEILEVSTVDPGMLYTLLDKHGNIIITSHRDQQVMTPLVRGKGELTRLDAEISRWIPALPPNTPSGERWKKSLYVKKQGIGTSAEWSLVLEQSVEPYQKALYDRYAEKLALLFLVLVGALAAAEVLSRRVDASILQLRGMTSNLPFKLANGEQLVWPESPVLEVQDLVRNFKEMTSSLTARFLEIRELNDTLEQRVARRTEQLGNLNRDFVNFLENTTDFIYFKDENSRFRFCSQPLARITGHASWRDMIGKLDLEVFPEETARYYVEEELPIFRDGTSLLNKINPYLDAQGRQGWVSTNKWPVFDAAGKVVGIFGISRDITETMQMQESLQLARQSLDQVPDSIIWTDLEGRIVDCNQGLCNSLGYAKEELLGSSISGVDLQVSGCWPEFRAELKEQKNKHFESTYVTRAGSIIPVDVFVTRISFGAKEFFCGIARDITERKAMEDQLRKSEAGLSRAQAMAKLGSWEWNPATDEVRYTDEIFNIFGIDREHFSGTFSSLVESMIHPEDRQRVIEAGERARQTGVGQTVEYRIIRPDGSLHWIRAIGEFVHQPGKPLMMIGANQDITEQKVMEEERLHLERQMLHLHKLESLGTLSGGIAHDFNNLLQVVLGNLDLTLMLLPEEAQVRKNLEQAVIATVRASELSGMMLAYSGRGVLSVQELNLSDLVQENSPLLAAVVSGSVSFTPLLHSALPPIQADATQLLQVVMNLVKNASEAIGEGNGCITLSTGTQYFDQPSLNQSRLEEKLPAGVYVWIEVSDTGCGMDEAIMYKVFDPFFTTKFTGRGLGLSAAQGIMRAHKGAILLESNPEIGTKVRLLFPVAPDPHEVRAVPAAAGDAAAVEGKRQNTILIVDDEEMIRILSVAMLQAFGFDTLVAADGEQALEIFRAEGERISMVLLDQSMPTMDGLSVFKELRQIRPEIKVLLASGYSRQELSPHFEGLNLNGFIQKPFNVKCLSDEVQRVLQET